MLNHLPNHRRAKGPLPPIAHAHRSPTGSFAGDNRFSRSISKPQEAQGLLPIFIEPRARVGAMPWDTATDQYGPAHQAAGAAVCGRPMSPKKRPRRICLQPLPVLLVPAEWHGTDGPNLLDPMADFIPEQPPRHSPKNCEFKSPNQPFAAAAKPLPVINDRYNMSAAFPEPRPCSMELVDASNSSVAGSSLFGDLDFGNRDGEPFRDQVSQTEDQDCVLIGADDVSTTSETHVSNISDKLRLLKSRKGASFKLRVARRTDSTAAADEIKSCSPPSAPARASPASRGFQTRKQQLWPGPNAPTVTNRVLKFGEFGVHLLAIPCPCSDLLLGCKRWTQEGPVPFRQDLDSLIYYSRECRSIKLMYEVLDNSDYRFLVDHLKLMTKGPAHVLTLALIYIERLLKRHEDNAEHRHADSKVHWLLRRKMVLLFAALDIATDTFVQRFNQPDPKTMAMSFSAMTGTNVEYFDHAKLWLGKFLTEEYPHAPYLAESRDELEVVHEAIFCYLMD